MEGEAPTSDVAPTARAAPATGAASAIGAAASATAAAAMARGALAFALGGAAAALLDWLRARGELAHLLPGPAGQGPLVAFLLGLYGGAGAALGMLLGLALWALRRSGALDFLEGEGEGAPLPALLLGAAAAAAAYGALLYGPALLCLLRFHHRPLIAICVGAVAAALLLPAAGAALLLGAGLRRLPGLGRGPRLLRPVAGARGLCALGWAAALLFVFGAVAALMLYLQGHPRMNAPLRALNLALLAPPLGLVAAVLGAGLGRLLARAGRGLGAWASSAEAALLLGGLGLAAPALLGAAAYWDTLRLVDLRPLTSLGLGVAVALAFALRARPAAPAPDRGPAASPRRRAAALLPLLLLPVLWAGALGLGRSDRVRKAALSQAPLGALLVAGLQAALDLDRDGYPSRWVVGGSDCDDLDPAVHPGAFDWPGDGVDQNCNGHEAALPEGAPPAWPAAPAGLVPRPSIVLITVDALRADHVGAYGYGRPTTPALDALAREGVLFEGAFAHAPSTRYSVPAILTGRYPSTIAWGPPAQHWPPEVLPENRLVSEMLKERGYRTTALLSYHYFEPTWGLAQGFDDYDYHLMSLHSLGGDPAATSGSSARELADLAIGKLAALPGDDPYFLWVHFYDPHYRYEHHPSAPTFGDGTREQDQYDNEIRYTDGHIGRLLAALRARPDWGRTAVLVTADHGEGFGEHGIPKDKRHGYHLYADQTKVPLILRVPGIAPRRVAAPVGHVDLAPTLVQLAGGRPQEEPQLLGGPVLALAAGASAGEDRQVFQEVMYEGPTVRKALVTRRFHYIRNVIPDGTAELFDLQADPQELVDLQGSPQVARDEAELSRRLAAWMDEGALPRDFARRVAGNVSRAPIHARQPVGARLGDLLEVVGVDVDTPRVPAGGSARFSVIFKVLRRVPPGWRLFMHLRRPDGRFTNLDHDPVEGLLPLQQLQAGQYVRDVVVAPIPKSWDRGPFQVDLGLFRGGERAEVRGPAPLADAAQRVVRAAALEVE